MLLCLCACKLEYVNAMEYVNASALTTTMHAGVAVREEAVKGLASIACPSNPHVIQALSMSCEDEDECVRRAAMRNLRLLLKRQEAKQVCAVRVLFVPLQAATVRHAHSHL